MKKNQALKITSIVLATAFALTACNGVEEAAEQTSGAEGFEYGASQEEVNQAIDGLEPVELVYQPAVSSPQSTAALSVELFKDEIEERSNGQISIEVVYGQAIAGLTEVEDALLDGRVDIAHMLPIYEPQEYPAWNAMSYVSQAAPSSPVIGEMVSLAMFTELGWQTDSVMSEFTDRGITPLRPMLEGGEHYFVCNQQNTGNDLDDWQGRQIRVGGPSNQEAVNAIGGTSVSMEYAETFEALQRNTVDCTVGGFTGMAPSGVVEVAPNVSYMTEGSFSGRATPAHLGGQGYQDLPLAYQQIIFDADAVRDHGWMRHIVDSALLSIESSEAGDGDVMPLPEDVQEVILDRQDRIVAEAIEAGHIPQETPARADELVSKWTAIIDELGYSEDGELADIASWYEAGDIDFLPFAERLYEEVTLEYRPQ